MHQDSMYLTGTEYHKLFQSKFLSKHRCKIESVKMENIIYYKITAYMTEDNWNKLENIIITKIPSF